MNFRELALGLASMEERADHRANCLLLRLNFIFHFYNFSDTNQLNMDEIRQIARDIVDKLQSGSRTSLNSRDESNESSNVRENNEKVVETIVDELLSKVAGGTRPNTVTISCQQLVDAGRPENKNSAWLGNVTDKLFRSSIPTIDTSTKKFAFDVKKAIDNNPLKAQAMLAQYEEPCELCHLTKYSLYGLGTELDINGVVR